MTPWSWRAAQEAFEADPRIAVTGPTTSHATTPQMIKRAELCRHYWNDAQVCGFAKYYAEKVRSRGWVDLPEVGGFAFFVRRDVWEELGGFDQDLPDYGNEVEFCRRITKSGRRIVWTQKSYIHHLGNQTYSGPRFGKNYIYEKSLRALEYIERKHGG
jgi:GT2 family glycosyltransferase